MTDKEKAIRWFENIAYECDKLTSGNVAHLKTQIKGMAIRSAEYLTKHSQELASDLSAEIRRILNDLPFGEQYYLCKQYAFEACVKIAQWQKEQFENSSSSVDLENKDLSDLIDKLSKRYPEVSFAKLARIVVATTKWQKSQDQQTIELAEEHAMLAGMMQERERMMKDAVDGWVARDKDGDIAIFREVPTKDAEIGMWKPCKSAYIFPNKDEYPDVTWDSEPQKVKIIIIKE